MPIEINSSNEYSCIQYVTCLLNRNITLIFLQYPQVSHILKSIRISVVEYCSTVNVLSTQYSNATYIQLLYQGYPG